MKRGTKKLSSLVLDDLKENLLRITEMKFEHKPLQSKWYKLRYYYQLVMDYERNRIMGKDLMKKAKVLLCAHMLFC